MLSSIYTRMTIEEFEQAFKHAPDKAIGDIYVKYKKSFIKFAETYTTDKEIIIDCFQEAVIALYENLKTGTINKKETALKTYLYAIGKNKILKTVSKKTITTTELNPQITMKPVTADVDDINVYKDQLAAAFEQLGDKCKDIIIRFYYYKQSIQEITEELNYKNQNTVKAQKSRCMAKLKELAHEVTLAS